MCRHSVTRAGGLGSKIGASPCAERRRYIINAKERASTLSEGGKLFEEHTLSKHCCV
jgi:hypothetical protein